jgi:hypothetical protein
MSSVANVRATGHEAGCAYRFQHPARPRPYCGLEVLPGALYCVWHEPQSRRTRRDLSVALVRVVEQPDHWLEGAVLCDQPNLRFLNLFRAKLPYADLENSDLSDTMFAEACLDNAVLRGATLNRTILSSSSLVGAALTGAVGDQVQLEYANLCDANLEGMTLNRACLLGMRLSLNSNVYGVEWGRIREICDGDFRKAAFVLRQLSLQLRPVDNRQADRFYFLEMTARHLWATRARKFPDGSWYYHLPCWLSPARRPTMIPICIGWALHRWVWGYAIRPLRTLGWMVGIIVTFAFIFHATGIASNSNRPPSAGPPSALETLALSLVTFATLGYGNRTPCGFLGEILGGCEAISGMLLSSMFLVALVNRYVQRG